MSRQRVLIGVGLVGPVIATLLLVLLTQLTDSQIPTAFGWVRHTQQVRLALTDVLSVVREAEAAQRLFIITNDSAANTRYRSLADSAPGALAQVRALVSDNPGQVARIDSIRALLHRRLAVLAVAADLMRAGRRDSAFAIVRTGHGPALMESLGVVTGRALAEEDRLLVEREHRLERRVRIRRIVGETLLGGSVMLALVVVLMLRALRRQRSLVTICAWSRVIRHENEWMTFEEYLKRKFDIDVSHGIAPDAEQRLMTAEFATAPPPNA